jgi:hypothetical protein
VGEVDQFGSRGRLGCEGMVGQGTVGVREDMGGGHLR